MHVTACLSLLPRHMQSHACLSLLPRYSAGCDTALLPAGATQAEKLSPAAVAATEHMSREEAYAALGGGQPLRAPVRDAVFTYWRRKRAARGRPLLRRLQAPTSSSDTNPFNVFRCARRTTLQAVSGR